MRHLFDFRLVPPQHRTLILACILFWSILCYLGLSRFVVQGGEVVGDSMNPTLANGDRYVINRLVYRLRAPRPGEVVALRVRWDDDVAVKRVIAGSGDRIRIQDGRVWVNDRAMQETYIPHDTWTDCGAMGEGLYEINRDCYFVLGDNRAISTDSRFFGSVKRGDILGRVETPD